MIKYRTCEYITTDVYPGQTFNHIVDEFAYDEESKRLIVVGKIDLQEKLDSSLITCLDNILQRFLNPENPLISQNKIQVDPRIARRFDLAEYGEILASADEMREKYNLNEDVYNTPQKVFEYVINLSNENVANFNKIKNRESEVEKNGKKKTYINEEVSKDISNSEQDSPKES